MRKRSGRTSCHATISTRLWCGVMQFCFVVTSGFGVKFCNLIPRCWSGTELLTVVTRSISHSCHEGSEFINSQTQRFADHGRCFGRPVHAGRSVRICARKWSEVSNA
jgi:hypothetical protein